MGQKFCSNSLCWFLRIEWDISGLDLTRKQYSREINARCGKFQLSCRPATDEDGTPAVCIYNYNAQQIFLCIFFVAISRQPTCKKLDSFWCGSRCELVNSEFESNFNHKLEIFEMNFDFGIHFNTDGMKFICLTNCQNTHFLDPIQLICN